MPKLTVIALCADWCHVCTGFAPSFAQLAGRRGDARFEWVDIEDEDDALEGVDVDDFPTLAVFHGGRLVHFGVVRAEAAAIERLLDGLSAKGLAAGADPGEGAPAPREALLAALRAGVRSKQD